MDNIYFLEHKNPSFEINRRTSSYHAAIFHGLGRYPATFASGESPPAFTNDNREPLHVRRSGRCAPVVWMPSNSLIVSTMVCRQVQHFGVDCTPIVLDRVVDVALPAIGDFSWYDRVTYPPGPDPEWELNNLPDDSGLRRGFGEHFEILSANLYERPEAMSSAVRIQVHFGTYSTFEPRDVPVSLELLEEYPVVWADVLQVRDDFFSVIAPWLDLDYFEIGRFSTEDTSSEEIDRFLEELG